MMRAPTVLMTGNFWYGGTERGLANGFRELGCAVAEVNRSEYYPDAGASFLIRSSNRIASRLHAKNYNDRIIRECLNIKPDIFFVVKGNWIDRGLLDAVRTMGIMSVMYYPDVEFTHPGIDTDVFSAYDLFITTKQYQIDFLKNLLGESHIAYVPHGYVDGMHKPLYSAIQECDYHVDLVHVGNHSGYKQQWFEDVIYKLPDVSVRLVGNRWAQKFRHYRSSQAQCIGERLGPAYVQAVQSGRINVAVHFGPGKTGWEDRVSTRTFEIPACKGFMLHIDSEEVRGLFEPGKEIDVFSSAEELADKTRFYLARPELRHRMIEAAYKRAVPSYSYSSRAQEIMSIINS